VFALLSRSVEHFAAALYLKGKEGAGMGAVAIQQMADRVADLMEERLRVRGVGLSTKLRRGKRHLPRKVALAASELADAAEKAQNPKLLVQIDQGKVAENYDICVRHLNAINPRNPFVTLLTGVAVTLALGLLLMGVVFIVLQRARGAI
jgi:hypothetical protein